MKVILFFIPVFCVVFCNAQSPFKPGAYKLGDSVMVGATTYYAKRNMAKTSAKPPNTNWTRTRPSRGFSPPTSTGSTGKVWSFEFSLDKAATVSAGTYKGEKLVNTIFSNRQYAAGRHVVVLPFETPAGLTVKVLSNNIKYEWEGVLANTSDSMSGPSVHHGYAQIYAALPYGKKLYVSKFYSEGYATQSVLNLSNIQLSDRLFNGEQKAYHQNTTCMATDGKYMYWAGGDGYKKKSYIFATNVSHNSEVIFASGLPYKGYAGRTYKSVIDIDSNTSDMNGVAVQKNGPYLFSSRAGLNIIKVFNKSDGSFVTSVPVEKPYGLSCDEDGNLFVCTGANVNKYKVNADGTIKLVMPLSGFAKPLSVSTKSNLILVADAGSQQVKAFDYKGNSLWVYGQKGGQALSAGIAYDKFYMLPNYASVAIQDDGSFWLADIGNNRLLHLSEQRKFIEQLLYTPHKYTSHVDPNNTSSVFSDFSEFHVDYAKPLRKSWTFINNWKPQVDSIVRKWYTAGLRPVTLRNGKRYTLLEYPLVTAKGAKEKAHYKVFELTRDGKLRNTGITFPLVTPCALTADGSVHVAPQHLHGKPTLFRRYSLLGFNGDNPAWGPMQTIATVTHSRVDDPNNYPANAGQITSNGTIIKYDHNKTPNAFHLAGIKIGDTAYSFRTQPSTTKNYAGVFPANGSFDIGNGVVNAGNVAVALDNLVVAGYKGEFWRNSQVNKWNVFHESGLMLGQFGVTGPEATYEGYPGMAGNVFTGSLVKNGDNYYLYHNDEGHLSGIHRWKITGAKSIVIQNIKPVLVDNPVDTNAIDLLKDIPYDAILDDNVAGFSRFPKTENYTDAGVNTWKVMTYTRSSEREVPEIAVTYASKKTPDSSFVAKDLGRNNTSTWQLSGKISVGGSYNSINSNNAYDSLATGCFWEVLDQNGTAIFRVFSQQSKNRDKVNTYLNGQLVMVDDIASFTRAVRDFNTFSIKCADGIITFNYLGQTSTVKANGNPNKPNKFRLYFFSKGGRLNRVISIKELIFKR
ncbi:MAG: hypothetical protein V4717_16655 [Bacteroidota bacterium]